MNARERNLLCSCGSGKKYKNCCGNKKKKQPDKGGAAPADRPSDVVPVLQINFDGTNDEFHVSREVFNYFIGRGNENDHNAFVFLASDLETLYSIERLKQSRLGGVKRTKWSDFSESPHGKEKVAPREKEKVAPREDVDKQFFVGPFSDQQPGMEPFSDLCNEGDYVLVGGHALKRIYYDFMGQLRLETYGNITTVNELNEVNGLKKYIFRFSFTEGVPDIPEIQDFMTSIVKLGRAGEERVAEDALEAGEIMIIDHDNYVPLPDLEGVITEGYTDKLGIHVREVVNPKSEQDEK